jgi:hypothetical protein
MMKRRVCSYDMFGVPGAHSTGADFMDQQQIQSFYSVGYARQKTTSLPTLFGG